MEIILKNFIVLVDRYDIIEKGIFPIAFVNSLMFITVLIACAKFQIYNYCWRVGADVMDGRTVEKLAKSNSTSTSTTLVRYTPQTDIILLNFRAA
jgi:hypothetical protein